MGYLGRRIGLSQSQGDSNPGGAGGSVGGGLLSLFENGYFEREGDIYNAPGLAPQSGLTATGGVISDYTTGPGDVYRAHVFTSSGTFDVTEIGNFGSDVDFLVVGGGGGAGRSYGGGGGAGGFRSSVVAPGGPGTSAESSLPISTSPGSYTVTVGGGGGFDSDH